MSPDGGQRLKTKFFGLVGAAYDDGRRAVVKGRRIAGGDGSILFEGATKLAQAVRGYASTRVFVRVDDQRIALALRNSDGDNLALEVTRVDRGGRLLLGRGSKLILFFTGDAVLLHNVFRGDTHVVVIEGVPKAIGNHGVYHVPVTHALAVAAVRQHMGSLAHALLATGNHQLGVTAANGLDRHVHCLQSGTTHLVDRHCRYRCGDAGVDGCLACRILAATGRQNLAKDYFVDLIGGDAGLLKQGFDNGAAQLIGTQAGQPAAEAADGGTFGGYDNYITHGVSPVCTQILKVGFIVSESESGPKQAAAMVLNIEGSYILRLRPPSTARIWPVINGASHSRKAMAPAMSSGLPVRARGVLASMLCW